METDFYTKCGKLRTMQSDLTRTLTQCYNLAIEFAGREDEPDDLSAYISVLTYTVEEAIKSVSYLARGIRERTMDRTKSPSLPGPSLPHFLEAHELTRLTSDTPQP
jgi:hypothetical protein